MSAAIEKEAIKPRECRVIFTPVLTLSAQQYRVSLRDALGHLRERAWLLGMKVEITTPKDVRRI